MLAVSRAGHDRGLIYVVLSEEGEYLFLADGKHRMLDHPKKKKKKHVQVIRHLPESILRQMHSITLDSQVRDIIKMYERRQADEK